MRPAASSSRRERRQRAVQKITARATSAAVEAVSLPEQRFLVNLVPPKAPPLIVAKKKKSHRFDYQRRHFPFRLGAPAVRNKTWSPHRLLRSDCRFRYRSSIKQPVEAENLTRKCMLQLSIRQRTFIFLWVHHHREWSSYSRERLKLKVSDCDRKLPLCFVVLLFFLLVQNKNINDGWTCARLFRLIITLYANSDQVSVTFANIFKTWY